jgi:hypothetical protein
MQVLPSYCSDHRTPILGVCPFCRDGVEPDRYREARDDFRHVPLAGTLDILPSFTTVSYEDVVCTYGQQLAELERKMVAAMAPLQAEKARIHREMRKLRLDPKPFNQAIQVHLGLSEPWRFGDTPVLHACLEVIRRKLT